MSTTSLRTKALTENNKAMLLRIMRDATDDCTSIRDAFDFGEHTLHAFVDARRGESEFFADVKIASALRDMDFVNIRMSDLLSMPEVDEGVSENSVIYSNGHVIVIFTLESADNGRHRSQTVSFGVLATRLAIGDKIEAQTDEQV